MPPEVAAQAARKRAEGIEIALGVLTAVGTIDGPEVPDVEGVPYQGHAFRPGASSRPTNQPHGVLSREGPGSD